MTVCREEKDDNGDLIMSCLEGLIMKYQSRGYGDVKLAT